VRKGLIITIDGPAGVGKSTVSKALAGKLSYLYLDTGAIYRAVAYRLHSLGITESDEELLKFFFEKTKITLDNSVSHLRIFMDNEEVTDKIRTEEIGFAASRVSAVPIVRAALLKIQRDMGLKGSVVVEGRDMGTVVFPDADVKFFLQASESVRTRRRYDELIMRGEVVDYKKLSENMAVRDKQDQERTIAPLRPHPDAFMIDSSGISVSEVVNRMLDVIEGHLNRK